MGRSEDKMGWDGADSLLWLPQMVEAIKSGKYSFVMCNFAPPDMVGHTGVYDAAVIACAATGELP